MNKFNVRWTGNEITSVVNQIIEQRAARGHDVNLIEETREAQARVLAPHRHKLDLPRQGMRKIEIELETRTRVQTEELLRSARSQILTDERLHELAVMIAKMVVTELRTINPPAPEYSEPPRSARSAQPQPQPVQHRRIGVVGYHGSEQSEFQKLTDRAKIPARLTFAHPDHASSSAKLVDKVKNCDLVIVRTKFLAHSHMQGIKSECGARCRWIDNGGVERAFDIMKDWFEKSSMN